jgi:hypothetical protein
MSEALAKLQQKRNDLPRDDQLNPEQQKTLEKLRKEAAAASSLLASGGKGGLEPGLVLNVMRRDRYKCKVCGEPGNEKNGGIGVHHKAKLENPNSQWLKDKKVETERNPNDAALLVTICDRCHDGVHDEDRARGDDEQGE